MSDSNVEHEWAGQYRITKGKISYRIFRSYVSRSEIKLGIWHLPAFLIALFLLYVLRKLMLRHP